MSNHPDELSLCSVGRCRLSAVLVLLVSIVIVSSSVLWHCVVDAARASKVEINIVYSSISLCASSGNALFFFVDPPISFESSLHLMPMTNHTDEVIVYSNSRNGLGIRILGARRATNKSGIYIKQLLDEGLAQRDGRLKVGDQILTINDETVLGISREHAVNLLRSAAATNQVRLRIRHFSPPFSSPEYQKFLYEEKSTDEEEILHPNNEVKMRKSSRRYPRDQPTTTTTSQRHSTPNPALEQPREDLSFDAQQSLLQSKFRLLDLFELLKKSSPRLFAIDHKRETIFIDQLSQNNPDGRITLKDFERQSSALLGERVHLLPIFLPSSSSSTDQRQTIEQLEKKIITCENSQRLANEIELEYEDLLKFLSEQLNQLKVNEANQLKHLRANEQLIQKLFHYLSNYVIKPADEQIFAQLKFDYEQLKKSKFSS